MKAAPSLALRKNPRRENGVDEDATTRRLGLLAWRLASETVAIRNRHRAGREDIRRSARNDARDRQAVSEARSDPFGTVAEIAADDALKDLDSERKANFADLIDAYTESVAAAAPNNARR